MSRRPRRQTAHPVFILFYKSTKFSVYYKCSLYKYKYVFISALHLLTLSGRFRVGFGVGHDRALTFRDRP